MFSKISFRTKMAIPVVIISFIFTMILVNVWLEFNEQKKSTIQLSQKLLPTLILLNDGYQDLYQVIAAGQSIILAKNNQSLIITQRASFEYEASKLKSRLASSKALIAEGLIALHHQKTQDFIDDNIDIWLNLYKNLFALNSGHEAYYRANKENMSKSFLQLRQAIKTLQEAIEEASHDLEKQMMDSADRTTLSVEWGTSLALVFSVFLTWYLSKVLTAPIIRLNLAMKEISSGEGDLTARVRVESEDEIGQLAHSFNIFVQKIHGIISEVVVASAAVRTEMSKIATITHSLASGASEQQQESDLVATAVHEMSATSDTVSDSANAAANASQKATDETLNAKNLISDTIISIQSLSQEIGDAGSVIHTLEQDVSNIGSILSVIRGIADQTNLLALNAAIEAARAGEQGRGFAVVADEVRALASKTQASTGEIQSMIEKLQNGANKAVMAMNSSRQNGQETVQQADIAAQSLDEIVKAIHIINDMNLQIATAATQQSQVSEDVNLNVQHIADNSHQVVEMVLSTESACKSLEQQCTRLDHLVEQFKM